jgi:uncharacterized damage-inducible protein DinB
MEDQERKSHLETLAATPARLKAALKGVPRKLLTQRPAPGKWSILEIVCHLRDMEREAYLARYRRILGEDNPVLPDLDGDALALERDYNAQKLAPVLKDWATARRESLKLLKAVKQDQWQRAGIHEGVGRRSLEEYLQRQAVGNDAAHLEQIEGIKRRADLLSNLAAGPATLKAATRGVSAENAHRAPSEGKWSIVEIACHLRDVERVFGERFSKMAFSDKPALWMMDNARVARLRDYSGTQLAVAVKAFTQAREDTLTLLRALPQRLWQRTGMHPKRGEVTIEALAGVLAAHDLSHIGRIREIAAS